MVTQKLKEEDRVLIRKGYYANHTGIVLSVDKEGNSRIRISSGEVLFYYAEDVEGYFFEIL